MSHRIREDSFVPGPYRLIEIPKRDGTTRPLAIPTVEDRVVLTAIAKLLTPVLDPMFSNASFGYRPGRSVAMAVRKVDLLRRSGHVWVAEADIHRCFERIPHDGVMARLEALLEQREPRLCALIGMWLEDAGDALGTPGRGLPQGSPLSPLLSNLHLDALDDAFDGGRVRIVRFADDFVLLAKTRDAAEAALSRADRVLEEAGLELASDKTRVLDPEAGLTFLGHLFVRSLVMKQAPDPDEDPILDTLREIAERDADTLANDTSKAEWDEAPARRVLHLQTRGMILDRRNMSFELRGPDGAVRAAIAGHRVDRIEAAPGTDVTADALRLAFAEDIPVAFVTASGETEGQVVPPGAGSAEVHLSQARAALDEGHRLEISRAIVAARVANMRARLSVLGRDQKCEAVTRTRAQLGLVLRTLPHARTVDALRGHEGRAAAIYWPALASMVRESGFCGQGAFRRGRPAQDGLNAAINYLTALLERDILAAIMRAGLHPGIGFLHATSDRKTALVWDLMEGFRALMTEGLAVTLINRRRLRVGMVAEPPSGGDMVRLSAPGRKALIAGYEEQARRRVRCPHSKVHRSQRAVMEQEARALARALRSGDAGFEPARQDY